METKLIAVQGQDIGTCEALRWQWTSIASYVLARGTDPDKVLAAGLRRADHCDVQVRTIDGKRVSGVSS